MSHQRLQQLTDCVIDLEAFPGLATLCLAALGKNELPYSEVEVSTSNTEATILRDGWTPEATKETEHTPQQATPFDNWFGTAEVRLDVTKTWYKRGKSNFRGQGLPNCILEIQSEAGQLLRREECWKVDWQLHRDPKQGAAKIGVAHDALGTTTTHQCYWENRLHCDPSIGFALAEFRVENGVETFRKQARYLNGEKSNGNDFHQLLTRGRTTTKVYLLSRGFEKYVKNSIENGVEIEAYAWRRRGRYNREEAGLPQVIQCRVVNGTRIMMWSDFHCSDADNRVVRSVYFLTGEVQTMHYNPPLDGLTRVDFDIVDGKHRKMRETYYDGSEVNFDEAGEVVP